MAEANEISYGESPASLGPSIATRTSSFEALDPHDPNLSRLATKLFQKTSDYLHGEIVNTQENYNLLERINAITITKYSDMQQMSANIGKTIENYNAVYNTVVKPILDQIDDLAEQLNKLEEAAYKLDSCSKMLAYKFKSIEKK